MNYNIHINFTDESMGMPVYIIMPTHIILPFFKKKIKLSKTKWLTNL